MVLVICIYAGLADTGLAVDAIKLHYLSFMILLRAKGLSLEKSLVVFLFKMFYWSDFVPFKSHISKKFMCVDTIGAHELFAFEAEACLGAVFPAVATTDLATISSFLYCEKIKQTVLEKSSWQFIEALRDVNSSLALRAAKYSLLLSF